VDGKVKLVSSEPRFIPGIVVLESGDFQEHISALALLHGRQQTPIPELDPGKCFSSEKPEGEVDFYWSKFNNLCPSLSQV